ncbi:MAG TPA: NUDIX hydrolase [Rhizomicrobium sp.]|nr:NUDIX hydrolase [Rhizomicrobium sp.]
MPEKILEPWTTVGRTELFQLGRRLRVMGDHVLLPDGREVRDYLRLEMPAYCVMLAFTPDERILCERHYKHGVGRVVLTLPAGTLEENEAALDGARRELLEETGYEAQAWRPLFTAVTHANARGPIGTACLATGCRKIADPATDDLEEIRIELLTVADLRHALDHGEMPLMTDRAVILQGLLTLGLLR